MNSKNILRSALNLSPAEKLFLIETLSQSLSEPNKNIDKLWREEVEQRFQNYVSGKIKTIDYVEILKRNESSIS